jgi:hypothetical protein
MQLMLKGTQYLVPFEFFVLGLPPLLLNEEAGAPNLDPSKKQIDAFTAELAE